MDCEPDKLNAREVLVLDSSTFIKEAGLTSKGASALKHYLFYKGTQLVVPEVVVNECERHLADHASAKVKSVHASLNWLARFCGGVSGWEPPEEEKIAEHVRAAACGEAFDAVVITETPALRERAELRFCAELPPSHKRDGLQDCRIWEQCLELLRDRDVVLVSNDGDFRGRGQPMKLHPQLRAEADAVVGGHLTFHPGMDSLLLKLEAEVPQLATETVLAFVYDAIWEDLRVLEANSGCRTACAGRVQQQLYTTDRADVLEIRLKVADEWKSSENEEPLAFKLSGSCRYSLVDRKLTDLSVTNMGLYMKQPDGTEKAVKGSYVTVSFSSHTGARPIKPEPVVIGTAPES